MKQVKQTRPVSHTIQSKTKAANQASIQTVLQKYKAPVAQREITEEDDLLQGKFENTAQLMELPEEEEEPLQGKFGSMENGASNVERVQKKEDPHSTSHSPLSAKNETGLPDQLKSGVENMSGLAMDAVRVHYNSPKPAQLQALAYTQGTDIHVAPGQEKHLPHEAWHVVQQMQGRVQPTMQLQGVNVNDNEGLEREADVMGGRALFQFKDNRNIVISQKKIINSIRQTKKATVQLRNVSLGENQNNITNFMGNTYEKIDYNLGHGHFNAKYYPTNKKLDVTLPVKFDNTYPDYRRQYFLNNVKNTWSNKHIIKTTINSTNKKTSLFWKNKLNPVNVNVNAVEDNANFYFNLESKTWTSDCVRKNKTAELSFLGWIQTKLQNIPLIGGYNVYGHETGHMFGIDDEYAATAKGHKTDHYNLTKKAFGKAYADDHAVQDNDKYKKSIMNEGTKVEKHHYVTFWDAMIQAIQNQYPFVPSLEAPNDYTDWKIF